VSLRGCWIVSLGRTDLSTEQLPSFLVLLPETIKELLIFEPAVVPKYRRSDPTATFCAALRRFAGLETFKLASHHVPPEPRNTLADLDFLKTVLVTVGSALASLQTLQFGLGRAELPKEALVSVAQALPNLRHLALLTKDLDATDLDALSHTLPALESLAVSAWIRLPYPPPLDAGGEEPTDEARAASIAAAGEWSFPKMRRFGEFSSEQSAQRPAGRRLLKDVVEQDIFFAERFPVDCKFGPLHPLTEHYVRRLSSTLHRPPPATYTSFASSHSRSTTRSSGTSRRPATVRPQTTATFPRATTTTAARSAQTGPRLTTPRSARTSTRATLAWATRRPRLAP
jgi:hypothetical protein